MQPIRSGIQQVGVGVASAAEAFRWYKKHFGFDTILFEDKAPATLMTRYTGGTVQQRYALLAMNLQGGGGLEIWQYTSRSPQPAPKPVTLAGTGVFAVKLRCRDVAAAARRLREAGVTMCTDVAPDPAGRLHVYVADPYGNRFELTEDPYWFGKRRGQPVGGVCGVVLGVSDMERSLQFCKGVLGYDEVLFRGENHYADLEGLPGAEGPLRRALLRSSAPVAGPFGRLLGPTQLELVEVPGRQEGPLFGGRYWGDLGFIHVCFDVCGMMQQAQCCAAAGYPMTVNSEDSFSMGQAAGHFCYNEDPDGTLIEYVETHRVPILRKLGWYLDLRKRPAGRPLPDWMLRCLRFSPRAPQLES
ncbi:VOC family protein [Flaviaesturariibacter amylovorans]|uniref:VOC domain-containing protein n=1 Tax=Flaviaesturariibacter amylovorans TaxID=1084520 RepID=A0ABP8HQ40_9BACT